MIPFIRKKPINRRVAERPKLYRMSRSLVDWFKLGFFFLGSLLLIGEGTHFFYHSHLLRIREVKVSGATAHLSVDEIVKLAQIPEGKNLFLTSLKEIEARVKRSSWVKQVQVRRNFPGGLLLHVEEYEPVAVLDAGDFYLVSREGKIFKKIETVSQGLPVITGFKKEDLVRYPRYFRSKILEAHSFLLALEESAVQTGFEAEKIYYNLAEGMTVVTKNPSFEIFFGKERIKEKINQWEKFVGMMRKEGRYYQKINLHVEGKIFAGQGPDSQWLEPYKKGEQLWPEEKI